MKKVLITGGSRGIGREIALNLHKNGYQVFSPSRSELDLSSIESIEKFFELNSEFDILINNAGINILSDLDSIDPIIWSQMLTTNLTAPMLLIKKVIPHMKNNKWGRIVNISSIFSLITKEKRGSYSAVKSGLNGLTRTAAVELGPYGILVNAICPGYVETDLTYQNNTETDIQKIIESIPLKRMAKTKEISEFVEFLISSKNSYITGQSLVIDGGFSLK